jgi:bifunctional non-homologous end joining protein LigD
MLKFKFCATLSAICSKVNTGKRSIALELYAKDKKTRVGIGNVTVYPNMDIPKVGDIVEVKYLYYFAKGSLFQPVLLGWRDDLIATDCTLKQLKYKQTEDEEN